MGVSISELLILLVIAIVLFGTRRLKDVGSDLGAAINSFRKAFKDNEKARSEAEDDNKSIPGERISSHHDNH